MVESAERQNRDDCSARGDRSDRRRVFGEAQVRAGGVIVVDVLTQNPVEMRSAKPFCHGDRGAVQMSLMPMPWWAVCPTSGCSRLCECAGLGYNRHHARPQPGVSVRRDSHSRLWHRHIVRA